MSTPLEDRLNAMKDEEVVQVRAPGSINFTDWRRDMLNSLPIVMDNAIAMTDECYKGSDEHRDCLNDIALVFSEAYNNSAGGVEILDLSIFRGIYDRCKKDPVFAEVYSYYTNMLTHSIFGYLFTLPSMQTSQSSKEVSAMDKILTLQNSVLSFFPNDKRMELAQAVPSMQMPAQMYRDCDEAVSALLKIKQETA